MDEIIPILNKSWTILDFHIQLCYTPYRLQAHKNQGLSGLPPIPGELRYLRYLSLAAFAKWTYKYVRMAHCFAEIAPSVRDLPLVKQN